MIKKFIRTLIVFMLFNTTSFAQESKFIKGKVLDSGTEEPIVFASLRIKNKAVGVVSNMDGTFKIPERFNAYGDTLEISSIGYKTQEILISTLSYDNATTIYLRPSVVQLSEVIVKTDRKRKKRLTARQIVRRALAEISNNYPVDSFSTVGYYRDYQLKDSQYINLNEAILEVFDEGFLKPDLTNTKVSIYDYRPNTDFKRDTLADNIYDYDNRNKILDNAYLFNYGGNEFTLLRVHDAIRNYNVDSFSDVHRLDQDLLKNHNFNKVGNTTFRNETLFKIRFFKGNEDYKAFGTLFISPSDYAIYKMEYTLYNMLVKKPDEVLNKHNTSGELLFEVIIEYQKKDGKMYQNYISFHNRFQLLKQPEFLVEEVIFDAKKNRFEVKFNNEVEKHTSKKNRNYSFSFKNKKIKFEKIESAGNKVFLYPIFADFTNKKIFKELSNEALFEKENKKWLNINIEKIRDKHGNLLNKRYYENFNQYREFFVQQIKSNSSFSNASAYMDKLKPIYEDQPIIRPDNFDDYWMNTPLKN